MTLGPRRPGPYPGLSTTHEAPDQIRGGVDYAVNAR
jgi:hypothetical protein